jgi:hypothetical protein
MTSLIGGRVGALPGATTGSLVCLAIQAAMNEIQIYRSRRHSEEDYTPVVATESKPWSERVLDRFGMFNRITDEQYLHMLKTKRSRILDQIYRLEATIEKEKMDIQSSVRPKDKNS